MKIFATGDTHGNFERFRPEYFPEGQELTKEDVALIPQGAGGSALALQETSKRLMERRRTLNTILAERSGLTLKRIQSLTCKDTYLEAERALDLGFVTRIIESRKEL